MRPRLSSVLELAIALILRSELHVHGGNPIVADR
jgi:hypothetical protein